MNEMEEQEGKSLAEYISLFKRRIKVIKRTAIIIACVGIVAAIFWPPTYRSTAVILIESQDIPQDLIRSTITSYAVQRIEEIKQRIMTTSNIMSLVERFELYDKHDLERLTRSEISKKFRDNLNVQPISADVIDPRSGNPTKAVIAFSLSYDGRDSSKVHKVTNELVTLYLNENLRGRTEQSNSTSDFLTNESAALDKLLKQQEEQLAAFKEKNKGSLPELNAFNLNILDRSEHELIEIKTRIQDLETRKIELASQLAQLSPNAPTILSDGKAVLSDADRLKALQSEYRAKSALYSPDHPDLQRMQREINNLQAANVSQTPSKDLAKQLQNAKDLLAQAQQKYTPDHPEIKRLTELVKNLESKAAQAVKTSGDLIPDNPSYVLLQSQLKAAESEIIALNEKHVEIQKKIKGTETELLKAPEVEKEYQALLRDYDSARNKFREISEKQMHADLGKNLEQERKGERFTLIQPPEIPEEPLSPNRIAILIIALVLAIGGGMASGVIAEAMDSRVFGATSIEKITGYHALVAVPYFEDPNHIVERKKFPIKLLAIALGLAIVALILFHFFVKPLDVTWYLALRKLGF